MAFSNLVIISSCFHIFTCVVSTPVQRLCPAGQYLDVVTGSCDHCSDICDMADVQGTAHLCHIRCPGFHSPDRSDVSSEDRTNTKKELCPPGTYLDEVTLRCDSCTTLCDEDKLSECEEKCPGHVDQTSPSLSRQNLNIVLWSLVATLSVIFVVIIAVIVVKYARFCSTRPIDRRSHGQREISPVIVPYIMVEEKPQQRIDQWLSLLHTREPGGETDSCYSSRTSLIYNPVKTKA